MSGRASRVIVAFALIASLLVVAATPAAAAHGPFVVSSHTTDSDFNSATLTNMSVVGSGASATVGTGLADINDGFESGSLSSNWKGGTSHFAVGSAHTQSGSFALEGGFGSSSQFNTIYHDQTSGTESVAVWVFDDSANTGNAAPGAVINRPSGSNSGYQASIHFGPDRLRLDELSSGSATQLADNTSVTLSKDKWYYIKLWSFSNNDTIRAKLYDSDGTTLLATVEATDSTYTGGYAGVSGFGTQEAWYDDFNATSENAELPAEYQHNHSATNTVEGFANVSNADNVTFTATWRGDSNGDGTYDTLLNQTSGLNSAGNHSFTWSEFSGDDVQLTLTVESDGSDEVFVLENEGVLANTVTPAVDNSSASPTGELSAAPSTFSINISDRDFATSQGDSVTVEFFSNTSGSEGTDTLTANGTASIPIGRTITEPVKWWAVATDSHGHETRSANFTATPPAILAVYNETAVRLNDSLTDAELVDEVEVEIRFLQDDGTLTIVTRSATNGTVNMSGLDPTQPFIAVATADGYYDRRVFVPSLYDAQELFMLPTNQAAVTQSFELQDFSGLYPDDESVLEIQRALAGEWRTVEGDYFGATGEFTATLRYNGRHRLVLTNIETGETEVLGTYTPISSEDKLIQVGPGGEISFVELNPIIAFSPDVNSLPATSTDLTVSVANRSTDLTAYNVTVLLRNSSGNTTLATFNGSNPSGEEFTASLDLTNSTGNVTVVVEWSTSAASGSTTEVYRIHEYFANENSLLAVLGDVRATLPSSSVGMFTSLFAVLTSVLAMLALASNWPVSPEVAGLTGVLGLTFWAIVGWLGWPVVFASGLAWVAVTALRRGV